MMPTAPQLSTFRRPLHCLAILGALVLAAGSLMAPGRVGSNLLLVAYYLVTLGLGGALFIALTCVSSASWNVGFRRIPEAFTGLIPPASLGLLLALYINQEEFRWHPHGEGDAGTFWFKELWTHPTFWSIRAVTYVVLWMLFSRALVSISRRQDRTHKPELTGLKRRLSAAFLVVYAITFSLASCDWLMLLEPMWFSTIWGVYHFGGMVQATLATMIILGIVLRKTGPLCDHFTDDHLHDLGKLLLGFSCFWMYIWFSQYMLIWYTNIPEETSYYLLRSHGPWGPMMVGNLLLNWVLPFFILLPRPCKRNGGIMMKVAVIVLVGRWLDLYLMIFPATGGPVFGLLEVAGISLLIGTASWLFFRSFAAAPAVPSNDPHLSESLNYHC